MKCFGLINRVPNIYKIWDRYNRNYYDVDGITIIIKG